MLKFIHAADVHLDSPMRGLQHYPGAPVDDIRGATRKALEGLVDLAVGESVDLVLIAGDLYDGDWPDYNTGLHFAAQMSRLREAGIRAVIARGNHDAASRITRYLKLPDNVTQLATGEPQTVEFVDLGVAVHGQSFAEMHVSENVVLTYPPARRDLFNIGMIHTSADGRAGHDVYAPCSREDLLNRGYQYWALGHVHKREVLSEEPLVLFPGNLQGRHIRESGPKGCSVVCVDGDQVLADERELAVVRWEMCRVPSAGCHDPHDLLDRMGEQWRGLLDACDAPTLAVRVTVVDDSPARTQVLSALEHWTSEARALATDVGTGRLWLEKLEVEAVAEDAPMLAKSIDDSTALTLLQTLDLSPQDLQRLSDDPSLKNLMGKLPVELKEGDGGLGSFDATLARLLPRVRALLLERLGTGRERA